MEFKISNGEIWIEKPHLAHIYIIYPLKNPDAYLPLNTIN